MCSCGCECGTGYVSTRPCLAAALPPAQLPPSEWVAAAAADWRTTFPAPSPEESPSTTITTTANKKVSIYLSYLCSILAYVGTISIHALKCLHQKPLYCSNLLTCQKYPCTGECEPEHGHAVVGPRFKMVKIMDFQTAMVLFQLKVERKLKYDMDTRKSWWDGLRKQDGRIPEICDQESWPVLTNHIETTRGFCIPEH